jgi:hypothetical protein
MVWFRVDDSLPTHHRVIAAGNAAMGLWVRCGAWSMGQLTDGFIPAAVAQMFGTTEEIDALLAVGLWTAVDGGYQFHRWAEDGSGAPRQPTRDEIEGKRKADRERKAAVLAARRDAGGRAASTRRPAGTPDGVAADSARNPVGIPEDSDQPDPTRPDPTPLTSFEGGANASPPVENSGERPSPFCPKHPTGTDRRCRACGDARRTHDAWTPPAAAVPPPRAPRWDPATHCEHGQILGACDACDYEQAHAATILRPIFGVSA